MPTCTVIEFAAELAVAGTSAFTCNTPATKYGASAALAPQGAVSVMIGNQPAKSSFAAFHLCSGRAHCARARDRV
ncbi:MAG TPA: hypothetical protein VIN93_14505 [Bryobacteraceae bacterium]